MEKWIDNNGIFKCIDLKKEQYDKLPLGVYDIGLSMSGWYLERLYDKFEFNYKIYNFHQDYLDYIINYYNSTDGNLGILFNGLKGSGKTVLAKLLCNQLNMPVIIMRSFNESNDDLINFIANINTDVVLFYDEFEKTFSESDSTILKLMDGVYNSKARKIHILTTNQLFINNNLLNRPSRLRYLINFDSLETQIVEAYIKDNLNDLQYYDDVMELVKSLSDVSIDILKQIISEINLFGFKSFETYKDIFNIEFNKFEYEVVCTEWFRSNNIKEDLPNVAKQALLFKENANSKTIGDVEDLENLEENNCEQTKYDYNFYFNSISTPKSFYTLKPKDYVCGGDIIYINHEKCSILVRSGNSYRYIHILNPYNSNVYNYDLIL